MKAMPYLFAISLAANLVLGWMLWQQHPAQVSEPAIVQSDASDFEAEALPLPTTSMPLTVSPLLPPVQPGSLQPPDAAAESATLFPLEPTSSSDAEPDKPYAPPPPPNPHAFPAWQQRTPHRESQMHRTLLTTEPR